MTEDSFDLVILDRIDPCNLNYHLSHKSSLCDFGFDATILCEGDHLDADLKEVSGSQGDLASKSAQIGLGVTLGEVRRAFNSFLAQSHNSAESKFQSASNFVDSLERLGAFGASWSVLGASWARLGAVLGRLGGVLGRLGSVLGRLGSVLGASWGVLGASWRVLGFLKASWAVLGGVLGSKTPPR